MLKNINLLGIRKQVVTAHFDNVQIAVMKAIDADTEKQIDKLEKFNTGTEFIEKNKIFLYGEVNINKNEDRDIIKRIFPMSDGIAGNQIHSNFEYESGTATPIDGVIKFYPEVDPIKWFKYCHCLLGKPTHIIVYKTTIGKL